MVNLRALLVRGLALTAVVLTYCVGGVVTQVASVVGVSSVGLITTSTTAQAGYGYRRRGYGYRGYGYGYRGGYGYGY